MPMTMTTLRKMLQTWSLERAAVILHLAKTTYAIEAIRLAKGYIGTRRGQVLHAHAWAKIYSPPLLLCVPRNDLRWQPSQSLTLHMYAAQQEISRILFLFLPFLLEKRTDARARPLKKEFKYRKIRKYQTKHMNNYWEHVKIYGAIFSLRENRHILFQSF